MQLTDCVEYIGPARLALGLQGSCSNTDCPYLHVRLDPQAPACKDFLQGHCPRGAACPHKHLTARMLKELRATRVLATAANAVQPQVRPCMCLSLRPCFDLYTMP